jgi:hypothetical protein
MQTPTMTADDSALARAAARYLDTTVAEPVAPRVLEDVFARTHALVGDAVAAARKPGADREGALAMLRGPRRDEALAAVLLLAKYTLMDLAECPTDIHDLELAHGDLAIYAEGLFRGRAVAGLRALAGQATQQMAHRPEFWGNVAVHCTHLLDLLSEVEEPAPPYMALFGLMDPNLPYRPYAGACAAQRLCRQVRAAVEADDTATLVRVFVQGSPRAVAEIFACTETLPRDHQARLLTPLLTSDAAPERLLAAVLATGRANRAHGKRGDAMLNRLLVEAALAEPMESLPVARGAVRELAAAGNEDGLIYLAEFAPLLGVAEEAVVAMKDLRRLLRVEPAAARRRGLRPVFLACREELTEIRHLMDAVWSSSSPDTAEVYLDRLRALHAFPELATVAQLADRRNALHAAPVAVTANGW